MFFLNVYKKKTTLLHYSGDESWDTGPQKRGRNLINISHGPKKFHRIYDSHMHTKCYQKNNLLNTIICIYNQ